MEESPREEREDWKNEASGDDLHSRAEADAEAELTDMWSFIYFCSFNSSGTRSSVDVAFTCTCRSHNSPSLPLSPLWKMSPHEQEAEADSPPLSPCNNHLTLTSDPRTWIQNNCSTSKSLRSLTLDLPDTVESIADSIGELLFLSCLRIRGKNLRILPSRITTLYHLLVLDFQGCEALAELPANINELISLKYLGIMGSPLIKSLPNSITRLPNLLVLDLRDCFNLKELPVNVSELLSLKFLYIKRSYLEYLPDTLTGLHNLLVLHLQEGYMLQRLPANLNELVNLRTLSIRNCNIPSLPNSITKLRNLQALDLQHCFSLRQLPPNLNELVRLKYLCIRGSPIESLPIVVAELHNLQFLELQDCSRIKELPENLNGLLSLRNLIVRRCKLTSLPESITRLHNLQVLDLQGCSMLEELPANLNGLVSLKGLSVRGTNIKSLPCSIMSLPNLQALDVRNCSSLKEWPTNLNEFVTLKGISITGLPNFQDSKPAVEVLSPANLNEFVERALDGLTTNKTVPQSRQVLAEAGLRQNRQQIMDKLTSPNISPNAAGTPGGNERRLDILTSENEDAVYFSDEEDTADDDIIVVDTGNNHHDSEDKQVSNISVKEHVKAQRHITLQAIQQLLPRKMKLIDAAKELGVSRSTLKRRWKEFNLGPWPSSRTKNMHTVKKYESPTESASGSKSSQLNPSTPSDAAGSELVQDYVDASTPYRSSNSTPLQCCEVNPNIREITRETKSHMMYGLDDLSSGAKQNKNPSMFIVKATYKEDIVRFSLASTSSIAQLKEEVAKRLKLEVSKLKMKYQDDDSDWVLITCPADLLHCLHLSKLRQSNCLRLLILDS